VTGGGGYRPESVSRVLARTGLILACASEPEVDAPLPSVWRDAFTATFGSEAPRRWQDPLSLEPTPWTPDDERSLIGQLEAKLGERFPAP